jgi:hypothetical protein
MYVPLFFIHLYAYFYSKNVYIFNNTLIIAVLAVALYKIQKLLNDVPQAA